MITANQCLARYGQPEDEKSMTVFIVPKMLEIGCIPKKIYCNKDLVKPLEMALDAVVSRGHIDKIKSWDGCFNIRKKRGQSTPSLHSWGLAIDINAAWNQFGKQPTMDAALVRCFTDNGFDWGGTWSKPDGMHFQLKVLP